ncbi:P-loop containing nucleoside triphosphate hydrolase protein [Clathrospora elynae]|uniref:P-loop containing nucleoside triphosphate hydrolase protein n=1 Tax=Clathrospora elynae TaxID=706981 RepID=A0A6A5SIS1_9PLEO|nr:P-loop containing nucleoside triphosphate hydrolase protein [Clathrospora elynae]
MATQPDTEPPNPRSQAGLASPGTKKRKYTYDPSSKEQFPDDPWYSLDHENIIAMVGNMCDSLVNPLQKFAPDFEGVQELIKAAEEAKKLPDIKQFCLAVLGEQGVGKSSLINALLDRDLLENSGSAQACTALATKILHKKGATDDTRKSDVRIEFLDEEEIGECIDGQIERWTDMYPGSGVEQQDSDDEDDGVEKEEPSDEESPQRNPLLADRGPKKTSRENKAAASTAKDFFAILFEVKKTGPSRRWLNDELHNTDIREGDFKGRCYQQAKQRLSQIGTLLPVQDGTVNFVDVADRNLAEKQGVAKKIWPFVKLVTLSTGHVLLRHGLCLFDLPGYGDTSHLREAVINTFRRKADFEMVVVPSSRVATSTTHDRYLDLSLHIKGAKKMMVVMNKSDALINENNMSRQITQIEEEPFLSFTGRLGDLETLAEEDEQDPDVIAEKISKLVNEITVAYIERETDLFRTQLQEKGITELFSVAAMAYTTWKNRYRRNDSILSPEQSGIPALRRFLFLLPAKTNIRDYREHAFESLPALRNKAGCVAEKHVEDQCYADMRLDCKQSIPALGEDLKAIAANQVEMFVANPWSLSERKDISKDIRLLIWREWIHSKIHFSGFAKMIRERGIPVNGKYSGRNLNADLVTPMKKCIKQWHDKMSPRVQQLARRLNRPIFDILRSIAASIEASSADPALKVRALEALEDARRRIATARNTFTLELEKSLRENRIHFTTEIDIKCPIAKQMKPVYELAKGLTGRGVMERQRKSIADSTTPDGDNPNTNHTYPLVEVIEDKLVRRQKKGWNTCCDTFIAEVIAQLNDFSLATERLLIDDAYMTEEHKRVRDQLKGLLVEFDRSLKEVQRRFTGETEEPPEKKTKCQKPVEESAPPIAPSEVDPQTVMVPINVAPGWFRATFGEFN